MDGSSHASRLMPPFNNSPLTTLNPYLSLSHKLSLAWLAYPVISLLFISYRLYLSSASAQDSIANAKGDLLTGCLAAQQAAAAAVNMPRYLAIVTNKGISDAVNGVTDGSREAMILALDAMSGIIGFVIDTYRSTFFCFLELVVRTVLSVAITATQSVRAPRSLMFSTTHLIAGPNCH